MGGEKKKSEKARIRKGINILVCTPGRLLDHLQSTSSFRYDKLKWLVLDEADRLLDMGFEKELTAIIRIIREKLAAVTSSEWMDHHHHHHHHQQQQNDDTMIFRSILVSATLASNIQRFAGVALKNPLFVSTKSNNEEGDKQVCLDNKNIDRSYRKAQATWKSIPSENAQVQDDLLNEKNTAKFVEESFSTPTQLKQYYVVIPCKQRLSLLGSFIRQRALAVTLDSQGAKDQPKCCKMIIFFSSCDSVDFHFALFIRAQSLSNWNENSAVLRSGTKQLKLFRLHGNLTQLERTRVYVDFNNVQSGILLCTDIAARGMDFPGIDWIVQYDPPDEPKEYIHRIGRTARLGREGNALLFLLPSELPYVKLLESFQLKLEGLEIDSLLSGLETAFLSSKKGFSRRNTIRPKQSSTSQVLDVNLALQSIQIQFERLLLDDEELLKQARKAFVSLIRAYSIHSKETKHIFHVKQLHLGHVAKSFALREPPSELVSSYTKQRKRLMKESNGTSRKRQRQQRSTTSSIGDLAALEFGSGF